MLEPTPDFEWAAYFEAAEKVALHHIFERVPPLVLPGMTALDLGCGVGQGTIYLGQLGLEVTAVDAYQEALDRLRSKLPAGVSPTLIQSDFRDLSFPPESFDLIVAINALYFLSPEEFAIFWPQLVSWIKPGGHFVGQFMGPGDEWAHRKDYNTQTVETAHELLRGFETLHLRNDERHSVSCLGEGHDVHVLHVVARKL